MECRKHTFNEALAMGATYHLRPEWLSSFGA